MLDCTSVRLWPDLPDSINCSVTNSQIAKNIELVSILLISKTNFFLLPIKFRWWHHRWNDCHDRQETESWQLSSKAIFTMSDVSKAALLVVVGEPFSSEHKELILERITKGKCVLSLVLWNRLLTSRHGHTAQTPLNIWEVEHVDSNDAFVWLFCVLSVTDLVGVSSL